MELAELASLRPHGPAAASDPTLIAPFPEAETVRPRIGCARPDASLALHTAPLARTRPGELGKRRRRRARSTARVKRRPSHARERAEEPAGPAPAPAPAPAPPQWQWLRALGAALVDGHTEKESRRRAGKAAKHAGAGLGFARAAPGEAEALRAGANNNNGDNGDDAGGPRKSASRKSRRSGTDTDTHE